jgi:hypothetical protein
VRPVFQIRPLRNAKSEAAYSSTGVLFLANCFPRAWARDSQVAAMWKSMSRSSIGFTTAVRAAQRWKADQRHALQQRRGIDVSTAGQATADAGRAID